MKDDLTFFGQMLIGTIIVVCCVGLGILFFVWVHTTATEMNREQLEKSEQSAREWQESDKNPINICIAKGGVPVQSIWDGRLAECQGL